MHEGQENRIRATVLLGVVGKDRGTGFGPAVVADGKHRGGERVTPQPSMCLDHTSSQPNCNPIAF